MSDPRHALTTVDIIYLIEAVNQASGHARRATVKTRYRTLREKLQRIGQFDAAAINSHVPNPSPCAVQESFMTSPTEQNNS